MKIKSYMNFWLKIFLSLFWLGCVSSTRAQKEEVFTPDAFIALIKQYHPIAKQANLQVEKANAELLAAKGGFDPILQMEATRKTFDGKNYYYYTNPELKIPTPIGLDFKTGIENNGGQFVSSETSKGSSSYLGAELPLAKGLLIDKRRATLQQAKIFTAQSEQEKNKIINDLLFDAYTSYWQWAGAYQLYSVYSKFVQNAQYRLKLVSIGYKNGDRSLMDTVEAFTQLQNFKLQQSEAWLKLANSSVELSGFLWETNEKGYFLPDNYVPDTIQFAANFQPQNMEEIIRQATIQHPALRSYRYKVDILTVERKLKFQSLLPTFNLKGNILSKDYYALKGFDANYLQNNFKWGIDFKIPIFLREGRGDYKKAQLKVKETNLELLNKQREIENKIRYYFNEASALGNQLQTVQQMYNAYTALLKNEELRFSQGESSLFIINSRENKTLEALQKQIELRVKFQKSRYAIEWAAGLLK